MRSQNLLSCALAFTLLSAQTPPAMPGPTPGTPPASVPMYKVLVIQGSAKAVNYQNLTGSTKIDMVGTVLSAKAAGVVKVTHEGTRVKVAAKLRNLPPAASFGSRYMTYVLWGISPEGRATNLGEMVPNKGGHCKLKATQGSQAFGLVLTAEPYFAVTQPSDAVVMENAVRKDSGAQVELIDAKFDLLKRDQFVLNPGAAAAPALDASIPLDVHQARNAIAIAQDAGAQAFAEEALGKAETCLRQAQAPDVQEKTRIIAAREAVQRAEDARQIAVQRQEGQRLAAEKKLIQDRLEEARLTAARAAQAEEEARRMAAAAQSENAQLRSRLMAQLNAVLQTRATAQGLIVNMNGVLFKTGKADLAPAAREKLSKIAGILAAHKGLKIEANGYTDSTGTETFNRSLSEKRAQATKDFLVSQGVAPDAILFRGFGEDNPIASNDTDDGRKENRRVELVVTGEGLSAKEN